MRSIRSFAQQILGPSQAGPISPPAIMEMLEGRQLLSTTLPAPIHEPAPISPPITVPIVKGVGVTIDETAGDSFTAVVGRVPDLSKGLLSNLKGLQAVITWNDYTGAATSKGVLSVNKDGALVVTGTHTYTYAGEHDITVNVSTVPPAGTTIKSILLATIDSTAIVSAKPIGVTFGIPSAGTGFTGVVGKVDGLTKSTLSDLVGLKATIAWGDHTATSTGTLSANTSGVLSVTGTHTYAIDGQYNVTITLATNPTNSKVASTVLAVIHSTADVGFVQPIGVTFNAEAGEPFTGVVGKVNGLDHATLSDLAGLQAVITWGDGSATSTGTLSASGTGTLIVNGNHTYAHSGKYAVTVVVETIPPVAVPPATAVAPLVLATINSYASVAANTEGGVHIDEIVNKPFTAILGTYYFNNTANYVQSATINWGDGTSSKGTIVATGPLAANWAVEGSHKYAKTGNYAVHIVVTATPAPPPPGMASDPMILLVASINSTIRVLGDA